MNRATAYKYCVALHEKLTAINGRFFTPLHSHEYVNFKSIYVVGSFVKGKEQPNDLDILIDYEEGGARCRVFDGGLLDKAYLQSYGIRRTKLSGACAFVWLTKGMRKVHRIPADPADCGETQFFDVRVQIYPEFKLTPENN